MKARVEDIKTLKHFFSVSSRLGNGYIQAVADENTGVLKLLAYRYFENTNTFSVISSVLDKVVIEEGGEMMAELNVNIHKAFETTPREVVITDENGFPEVYFEAFSSNVEFVLNDDSVMLPPETREPSEMTVLLFNRGDFKRKVVRVLHPRSDNVVRICSNNRFVAFENVSTGIKNVVEYNSTIVLNYRYSGDYEHRTNPAFLKLVNGFPKGRLWFGVGDGFAMMTSPAGVIAMSVPAGGGRR